MTDRWVWAIGLAERLGGVDVIGVLSRDKTVAARCFTFGLGQVRRTVLLDPRDGAERLRGHLKRAGVQRLLVDADVYGQLAPDLRSVSIVVGDLAVDAMPVTELAPPMPPTAAAHEYVIFTSGSTGEPGMVVQTVAGATALAAGYLAATGIDADDVVGVFGSCGHDAFVVDIMSSLVSGCRVSFLDPGAPRLVADLPGHLRGRGITVWHSVPTVWRTLAGRSRGSGGQLGLRLVVLGGEAVDQHDLRLAGERCPQARVFALYGQSEISVVSGLVLNEEGDCGLLGADFSDVETGLRRGDAVESSPPEGADGELLVRSPWHATAPGSGDGPTLDGWWPTGDLVRREGRSWRFVGRGDDVVNLHGERIGLVEVERAIRAVTGARDALAYVVEPGAGRVALGALLDADDDWTVPGLNAAIRSLMPSGLTVRQVTTGPIDQAVGRTGKADRTRQRLAARRAGE